MTKNGQEYFKNCTKYWIHEKFMITLLENIEDPHIKNVM